MTELHVLYRFFDQDDQLLYVGITKSPLDRMKQHQRDKGWFRKAVRTTYEQFDNRADLEAAEIKAIQSEKPKYNIAYAIGSTPSTVTPKNKAKFATSRDARRFQHPDAIASDDELTDHERNLMLLEQERKSNYCIPGQPCPSCDLIALSQQYDGLIKCMHCLDMFLPEDIPSVLDTLKKYAATAKKREGSS